VISSLRFVFLLVVVTVLSGCRGEKNLPKAGRYVGQKLLANSESQQVIAQVPDIKEAKDNNLKNLEIFPTLGSAQGDIVTIRLNDKMMFLSTSALKIPEQQLTIQDNCASGSSTVANTTLCWAPDKLDLEMRDPNSQSVLFTVHLIKDDQLAPLKDHKGQAYTLDELIGRAKFLNYTVAQEAERVYQAKQNIKVAVGNLLPHFNMTDLLSVGMFGPMGFIGAIGDLMPFLFPSNWFQLKKAKFMSQAERKSFVSLRGNEMNAVENLYYVVQRDVQLKSLLERHFEWLRKTQRLIQLKEQVGHIALGSTDKMNIQIVMVEQDLQQLRTLVAQEMTAISQAVALSPIDGITDLAPVSYPDLSDLPQLDARTFYQDAQKRSYEVATLDFLIKAAHASKKETIFGFLDPSSQGSIGFGYGASIRVAKSQENEIRKRREETLSLIEKRSADVVAEYNNALVSYQLAQSGLTSSRALLDRLNLKLASGQNLLDQPTFMVEFLESIQQILKFEGNRIGAIYFYLMAKSKLDRLLLQGYYQSLEDALPAVDTKSEFYEF